MAAGPVDAPSTRAPAGTLGRRGHVRHDLVLKRQHPLRAAVQPEPRLGRLDAPAGAIEELRPEALLERPHLQRHRRLRHAEPLRRLRSSSARRPRRRHASCRVSISEAYT